MTRRAYPILGPSQLRLFDATKRPSKPVYLRLRILRGRSRDQSGPVRESHPGPDPGPDPGPVSRIPDPSISDLNNITKILVKRPYEPI